MKIWAALAVALLADMVGVLVSAWPGGAPPPAPHPLRTVATSTPALPQAPPPGGAGVRQAAAPAAVVAGARQVAPGRRPAPRRPHPRSPATERR